MISPCIKTESIRIQDGGELKKGLYFYALTVVDKDGNESYPHVVQIYNRFDGGIVSFFWDLQLDVKEYRLYRGSSMEDFEGYFSCDSFSTGFHDSGVGILNEFNTLKL